MKSFQLILCVIVSVNSSLFGNEPDLDSIDANGDGIIEPQEVPSGDMIVLSRYASLAKRELSQPVSTRDIERGRDLYLKLLQGSSTIEWHSAAGRKQFGRIPGSRIRPFGVLGEIAGNYTGRVRDATIRRFQQFDSNRDGLISPSEREFLYRERTASWMRGDRDGDGLLTFAEMATAISAETQRNQIQQAYSRSTWNVDGLSVTPEHRNHARRLMQEFDKNSNRRLDSDEIPSNWKSGNMLKWSDENRDGSISEPELFVGAARWMTAREQNRSMARDPDVQHCEQLATEVIRKHDRNDDQVLVSWEWRAIGGDIAAADANANGTMTRDELSVWLLKQLTLQPGAALADNLPSWFLESDLDLDGQVLMSEFINTQPRIRLKEFQQCDRNVDGIVTALECSRHILAGKLRFSNDSPQVIEANGVVRSEITISEDFIISDIDVHVAILKDGDDDLQLQLVSPDGMSATLYHTSRSKAWGGGRMFDGTLIDDEAPQASQRLPAPPSHRSFRSQGANNAALKSLSDFYGKPASGTWQLVIANRAENSGQNAGLLQGWTLLIDPRETVVDEATSPESTDSSPRPLLRKSMM